ncbi:MAG: cytochrome ubiquinol oxidase subunit I [Deltaproteobacteria bacterium]|nr:cytochrome ubiquinol oxidase subunit I [Deltaproteobacteria bacterium]
MSDLVFWHRLQFGFTAAYHYLFPQLTMGLALFIVLFKLLARRTRDERYQDAARFWIRIFGVNFAVGVVTGIPMEFQFGTNWAQFSSRTGEIIGQTLAMEGMFAFFLESTFLGVLLWGEKRFGRQIHDLAALALFVGSWLSGYFIIATNAFMQHPVGHRIALDGTYQIASFLSFLLNPWALAQYAHNMIASVVTASFVVTAVGAFYTLRGAHREQATLYLKTGVVVGLVASLLVAFPTGDWQAKLVAKHQPVTLAAMEGRWSSGPWAEINLIGQPDVLNRRLDNPLPVPGVLSFLAHGSFDSNVRGLDEFPAEQWPTNIELLYYSFHIMVGLGTIFIALLGLAAFLLWRRRLARTRWMLWLLTLAFPFPYIANTAGWMTAEMGRQPWLIYGLLRTRDGASHLVHDGQTVFTSLGFAGIYVVLGFLFVFLIMHEVAHGPVFAGPATGGHKE